MRKALAGPMDRMIRNSQALLGALEAPYASILANQERLVRLAEAAAVAASVDLSQPGAFDDGTDTGQWAAAFVAALRAASPSLQQLEILLNHLAFLLTVVVTAIGLDDGLGDNLELAALVAALMTGCSILCFWIQRLRG